MNPLRCLCLLLGLFTLACAANDFRYQEQMHGHRNSIKNSWKPSNWLSTHELESMPSLDDITFEKLEKMPLREGAEMLNKMYHLMQFNTDFKPTFTPQASEIWVYMYTPNMEKMSFKLHELPRMMKEVKYFGDQEVTIFITGLPQESETIKKATRNMVEAYMRRYSGDVSEHSHWKYDRESGEKWTVTSSEESFDAMQQNKKTKEPSGNLIVVDLGSAIPSFMAYATMDVEETGAMMGDVIMQLTDKTDVVLETVHVIGSNIAAHVAGAAGRQYTRRTGHKLRRITGLDPSKIFARRSRSLTGLARGDAEFVDVIHTSAYGMGTSTRNGDVDFYPNGPSTGVPGADNVIEASMRAVRYFAESVMPGWERSFPAVKAVSLEAYKNKNGHGKRVYMGIKTDYDVEGDFVLEVNAKSPFGRMAPAERQQNFHTMHKPWNMSSQEKDM